MSDWDPKKVDGQYDPAIGGNVPYVEPGEGAPSATYADINSLRRNLNTLIDRVRELENRMEENLLQFAMPVGSHDSKLLESHRQEWPSSLGEPGDQITYRYYKALRLRTTTSAEYIRKRYEEAARGVTGTSAIDILAIAAIIKNEALLIQEFINVHINSVDDSSEFRVLELFQDWVEAALTSVRQFWDFFEEGETAERLLPENEIERTSGEEAKQGQAVFKVKLNTHNASIVSDLEFLHKNFSEFAPTFYKKFLGPAIDYRLRIGRRTIPTNTMLSREIESASKALDTNLRTTLADQMRRSRMFSEKMVKLRGNMTKRDRYRSNIKQLAAKGNPVPVSAVVEEFPEEIEFWTLEEQNATATIPADSGTFRAPHHYLDDLGNNDHDQYLLRGGGNTISGDIVMDENTLIDGIRPATHRHTGGDGTLQIRGPDILDNTLLDDVVDIDAKPPRPINLRVVNFRVSPDSPTIEATISWDGDDRYTYEVQVAVAEIQGSYANPMNGV